MNPSRRLTRLLLALCLSAPAAVAPAATETPRPAAVAGDFYPADRQQLANAVKSYLRDAMPGGPEPPVALICPHAGYLYSGQIAADAYRQAMGHDYDVVVIVGVNHRTEGFYGVSVYDGPGYATPLGVARCDRELARTLRDLDKRFVYRADVHAVEHSVEVQVPFVQTILPGTPIVTAVIGGASRDLWLKFGDALAAVLGPRKALLVASSDLSHYPPHDAAETSDHAVLAAVATLDPDAVIDTIQDVERRHLPDLVTCACGEGPIVAVMSAARQLGATRATVVSYANSGDTSVGDWQRCVGYGAVALTKGDRAPDTSILEMPPPPPALPGERLAAGERRALLDFARKTLEQYFAAGTLPLARGLPPALQRKQGAFVTLKSQGRLRGCIGHMADDRPLAQVVGAMAVSAAFDDHRFTPLQSQEMKLIDIEISVLTPFAPIASADDIVLGRDGVLIRKSGRSAVYLPQVATEQGWDRDELLRHLCRKANLPADAWREGAQLLTFQAEVFGEDKRR